MRGLVGLFVLLTLTPLPSRAGVVLNCKNHVLHLHAANHRAFPDEIQVRPSWFAKPQLLRHYVVDATGPSADPRPVLKPEILKRLSHFFPAGTYKLWRSYHLVTSGTTIPYEKLRGVKLYVRHVIGNVATGFHPSLCFSFKYDGAVTPFLRFCAGGVQEVAAPLPKWDRYYVNPNPNVLVGFHEVIDDTGALLRAELDTLVRGVEEFQSQNVAITAFHRGSTAEPFDILEVKNMRFELDSYTSDFQSKYWSADVRE